MSDCLWLLRHGETPWSERDRHTGRADPPLTAEGREEARQAGRLLQGRRFSGVLVSPQRRALETCWLAGYGEQAETCSELVEWDYGEVEGLTDAQTDAAEPGWDLFRDGAPGGESPEDVVHRLEGVLLRAEAVEGRCLLVGHGKVLRALGALWIGAPIGLAAALPMDPGAICVLEREGEQPLLRLWNRTTAS